MPPQEPTARAPWDEKSSPISLTSSPFVPGPGTRRRPTGYDFRVGPFLGHFEAGVLGRKGLMGLDVWTLPRVSRPLRHFQARRAPQGALLVSGLFCSGRGGPERQV